MTAWTDAQAWEAAWWRDQPERWAEEERKHRVCARLMGLPDSLDMGGASVLDVGCGPVSMLRRTLAGHKVGVEPLPMSDDVLAEYRAAGVEIIQGKAEEIVFTGFDEVWAYNLLQHVEDPAVALHRIAEAGRVVRLFDWLDMPACPGHPHELTESLFHREFDSAAWLCHSWIVGRLYSPPSFGHFIAAHLERRTP